MSLTAPAKSGGNTVEHSAETEHIWQEMHQRLLSFITGRLGTVHDAEDILQDVFVRIHSNLDGVRDTQSITAWIYQITRNAITDFYRKRAAAGNTLAGLAENFDETTHDEVDVEREAEQEFTRCMVPLLNELPEHYRQALVLTELNGVAQTEAAGQLGLSVSGMKARVQRGRAKLKDVVDDCCRVELDRRGGLVDYERRDESDCKDCE